MKLPFHLSALLLAGVFLVLVGCGGGSEDQSPAPSPRPSPAATGQPGRFNGPVTNLIEAPDGSGEIYVAGLFTTYNDQPVRPVVRVKQDGTLNPALFSTTRFDRLSIHLIGLPALPQRRTEATICM